MGTNAHQQTSPVRADDATYFPLLSNIRLQTQLLISQINNAMEDLDFGVDLESPIKKSDVTRRRRSNLFGNANDAKGGEISKPPPKPRRNSGWADEGSSGLFRFRRQSTRAQSTVKTADNNSVMKDAPKVPKTETILDRDDDSDADMPIIPDLNEAEKEDLTSQVAQAPSASQLEPFQHLDGDLLKQAPFSKLDGIDLRLLARYLSPEGDLKEPDVPWTWDVLFTEVLTTISKDSASTDK
ncbi:intraflagellar transport protein 43 homolog isoform X2 [Ornithodoros turicata]|uniref:intraflagellar transport protein 43 homolog isoform X2 n=1 Tax=Ornithodoros turicata TaxID=34597 RepID=UPI00313897FC